MKRRKEIFATIAGNVLEYYDVTLYGYFAAFLAPLYFPFESETSSIIASFVTFALGFVTRPLGGIVFGHLGDRLGRKRALALTIFLVTIPTFTIGILPTYETIGLAAPAILIACRLLQGLCAGGEFAGAAVFINEHAEKGKDGFAASLLATSGFVGAIIGTAFGAICTAKFMPDWAWRLPFVLAAVFGVIAFYIRYSLEETRDFKEIRSEGTLSRMPLLDAFKDQPLNIFCAIGMGAAATVPYYALAIYMGSVFASDLKLPTSQTMLINMGIMIYWAILLPIVGRLSDRVGKARVMMIATFITAVTAFPAFWLIKEAVSLERVILIQLILTTSSAAFVAPVAAVLPTLFAVKERYSGIGFAYSLGGALFGSTTPIISTILKSQLEMPAAPAIYITAIAIVGILSLKFANRAYQKV